MHSFLGLLVGITRNDNVVLQQGCPDKSTAVYSLCTGASPKVGNAQYFLSGFNDALSILFQMFAPFVYFFTIFFRKIPSSAIWISYMVEVFLRAQQLKTVTGNNVTDCLRFVIWLAINKSINRSYNHLWGMVPCIQFRFCNLLNSRSLNPSTIFIRCLDFVPTIMIQYFHGHTQ